MRLRHLLGALLAAAVIPAAAQTVRADHPRLYLTPTIVSQLAARRSAGDPRWMRLKTRADGYLADSIFKYTYSNRSGEPDNSIFYDYQGQGWYDAAMTLAMAYVGSGDSAYAAKLGTLVDEMVRAQSAPENNPPIGQPPLRPDNYYSTRFLGPILAVAYDWCYARMSPARRAAIIALMNAYFDDLREFGYQRNDHADGNYFSGHLFCAAAMGYATFGNNPRAQEMIDYARIRFDNTPSTLIDSAHRPTDFVQELFEGGYPPALTRDYNAPKIYGAPFRGGFDFQGWAYGTGTFNRFIDYMLVVGSATGENLIASHGSWLSQIFRAEVANAMPDHFATDPSGDYGSDYGPAINRSLPVRLANVLAGSGDGPMAQYFSEQWITKSSPYAEFPDYIYQYVYQPAEWEDFLFTDTTRAAAPITLPAFHCGLGDLVRPGDTTNGAMPTFWARTDWSDSATWVSAHLGASWYNDHQHTTAGHINIHRGGDQLLVDASNWKGDTATHGLVGSSLDEQYSPTAVGNTLFFDDRGDFQRPDQNYFGGQGIDGWDHVGLFEQTADYTLARADLSTAYNRSSDSTDQGQRRVSHYEREVLYLRAADVTIVLDQFGILPPINPASRYRAQLRWHVPNRPDSSSAGITVRNGASRLLIAPILPASPRLTLVSENPNPDPCAPGESGCTPWQMNSGTWRIEESDADPIGEHTFLTALCTGSVASGGPFRVRANGGYPGAVGIRCGFSNLVIINTNGGAIQSGLSGASCNVFSEEGVTLTCVGMKPGGAYKVVYDRDLIVSEGGPLIASPAGVLRTQLITGIVDSKLPSAATSLLAVSPNPATGSDLSVRLSVQYSGPAVLIAVDLLGRTVATMNLGVLEAGVHVASFNTDALPAGAYRIVLRTRAGECSRGFTLVSH